MNQTNGHNIDQFVERYISLWNEPASDARRKLIRELWAPDGGQVLVDPPMEVREAAQNLSFPIPPLEVRGHDVLEARVTRAYEMFIASGEYAFTLSEGPTELLKNVVTIAWAMTSRANGEVAGKGLDVFRLGPDGRIRTGYQFIEG